MFSKKTRIRIVLRGILILVLVFLFWQNIVPMGQIEYVYDFDRKNYNIGELGPEDRLEPIARGQQNMLGDPVYFSLYTPRGFDRAELVLEYRNESDLPLIETGVLVDETVWRYALKPVENRRLDQLALVWDAIEENGVLLLQKDGIFDSISSFLKAEPPLHEIAVYNYDLDREYLMSGYQAADNGVNITNSLRGPHEFAVYVKNEKLDVSFTVYDLNRNRDPDPVDIDLYYNDELLETKRLDDDGITADSGEASDEKRIEFNSGGLPEGVYRFLVRANDDTVISRIESAQHKLAWKNKLWLYNDGKLHIDLYTDSVRVQAMTPNPQSLQKISSPGAEILLDETYRQFEMQLAKQEVGARISLEKDGVIISGNGMFAFAGESLFNPALKRIDNDLDVVGEGVKYVIARYSPPQRAGEWKRAAVEMDISSAYREDNKYSFIISVPGLRADDIYEDSLEINSIKIKLKGKTLGEKVREIFR